MQKDPDVWIYFGSQTGTARRFADVLSSGLSSQGWSSRVVDLVDFNPKTFVRHKCILFCVSTYGNGEPPASSVRFFEWLENTSLPQRYFADTSFAVMGLGSRDYVGFNHFGRYVVVFCRWGKYKSKSPTN